LDICAPQLISIQLEPQDKIVKIKAGFDRSCAITGRKNKKHFLKKQY